jgi:hypothetical protein
MRLYNPAFESKWPILVIAFVTAGVMSLQSAAGQAIGASGRLWIGHAHERVLGCQLPASSC